MEVLDEDAMANVSELIALSVEQVGGDWTDQGDQLSSEQMTHVLNTFVYALAFIIDVSARHQEDICMKTLVEVQEVLGNLLMVTHMDLDDNSSTAH